MTTKTVQPVNPAAKPSTRPSKSKPTIKQQVAATRAEDKNYDHVMKRIGKGTSFNPYTTYAGMHLADKIYEGLTFKAGSKKESSPWFSK